MDSCCSAAAFGRNTSFQTRDTRNCSALADAELILCGTSCQDTQPVFGSKQTLQRRREKFSRGKADPQRPSPRHNCGPDENGGDATNVTHVQPERVLQLSMLGQQQLSISATHLIHEHDPAWPRPDQHARVSLYVHC